MCSYGPMVSGGGDKIAFLLIALALGYWVLNLAESNPNPMKLIGRFVAWIVLIVSVGGLICSAVCGLCKRKQMCPMPSHMAMPLAEAPQK